MTLQQLPQSLHSVIWGRVSRNLADTITWARLFASLSAVGLFVIHPDWRSSLFYLYLFGCLTDLADGEIARSRYGHATEHGARLDERVDKVFVACFMILIVFGIGISQLELVAFALILGRDAGVSWVRIHGGEKAVKQLKVSLLGKTKMVFLMGALGLLIMRTGTVAEIGEAAYVMVFLSIILATYFMFNKKDGVGVLVALAGVVTGILNAKYGMGHFVYPLSYVVLFLACIFSIVSGIDYWLKAHQVGGVTMKRAIRVGFVIMAIVSAAVLCAGVFIAPLSPGIFTNLSGL
jgi:phosphatidylglycerophosphate synthase